ncbi:MAG: hypothetical protein WBL63_19965 [Candidatus Acidiferrum sp.]
MAGRLPEGIGADRITTDVESHRADTVDAWGPTIAPDEVLGRELLVVKFQNNPQHRRILANELLGKWDDTLSNVLQQAPQKGVYANDLDAETERLYADHVAPEQRAARVGAPGSRGMIRSYCAQVLRQARLWERLQKGVRAEEFTFPEDPMRIDYGYRRNGTRGFVQTLSVTRAPGEVKSLAYTVERIRNKVKSSEFTAVTDVHLIAENERHRFVQETLRDAGVEAVAMEGFAVRTAKMRPVIQ